MSGPTPNCHILIVDDGPVNLMLVQNLLSKQGYTTVTAENGQLAINRLRTERFDLVLMDLEMPEMDGITASQVIRRELLLDVPIIAVSASERAPYQALCVAAGMNGFISKPFLPEELYATITEILTEAQAALPARSESVLTTEQESDILDLSLLRENSFNDEEFMKRMVALMISETTRRLLELREALDGTDFTRIRKLLHTMKPSVDHVAQAEIRAQLRYLETVEPDGVDFTVKAEELLIQLSKLVEALRAL